MEQKHDRKPLVKATSPTELDTYLKVPGAGSIIVIVAILVLLAGFVFWSIFGTVEIQDKDGSAKEVAPVSLVLGK